MHIGFDAKRAFNNSSGLGNYSRYIIDTIARLSVDDLYLFTPKAQEIYLDLYGNKKRVHLKFPKYNFLFYGHYWRSSIQVKDYKKLGLDIFHGLSNELPLSISSSSVGKVVTIHDLIFMRYPELYRAIDRKIYQKKFLKACIDADKIVAISQQTKDDLQRYFNISGSKIEVIYQDCDSQFHLDVKDADRKSIAQKYSLPESFVLSVGTIERRKNQLNILRALNGTDIPLVLVGRSTKYQEELQTFIKEKGMTGQVIFINNVNFNELPTIYNLATVFVYPSIFEGFGIPIIEAQNQGTPVVTSKGSCFNETGADAALYAAPDDPNELRDLILEVFNNAHLREGLKQKGSINVQRFRAENTYPQLQKIYESL